MTTLAAVLERLPAARRAGAGWLAPCPTHRDPDPSLSVTERNGRVLLHCFAGCEYRTIAAALGIVHGVGAQNSSDGHAQAAPDPLDDMLWRAVRSPGRRRANRILYACSDAYRHLGERIRAMHAAAERLPPDLDATWEILARAQTLEDERRLIGEVLDRWHGEA